MPWSPSTTRDRPIAVSSRLIRPMDCPAAGRAPQIPMGRRDPAVSVAQGGRVCRDHRRGWQVRPVTEIRLFMKKERFPTKG